MYIAMAAILVMQPKPFVQTFVALTLEGSVWNLAWTGPMDLEKNMSDSVNQGRWRLAHTVSLWLTGELISGGVFYARIKTVDLYKPTKMDNFSVLALQVIWDILTEWKKDNKQCLSDTPRSNGQWRKLISRIQRPYKMAKFEKQ